MNLIELQIHAGEGQPIKVVEIDETATIEELLKKAFPETFAELDLVLEEGGEPLNLHHRMGEAGIRHRHVVHCRHKIHLVVNGKRKNYSKKTITFDEVVALAYGAPNYDISVYTVTYYRGPERNHKGSMSRGESVFVKDGMVFDVIRTDKS